MTSGVAAVAGMLEGMPESRRLQVQRDGGRVVVTFGSAVLFEYAAGDAAMRNVAISTLRRLEFSGRVVAESFGLSDNYVATLHAAAVREGSVALMRGAAPGRPRKLGTGQWEQAAAWRAGGVSDAEIGRRLGVANTTVGRRLGPRRPAASEPASEPTAGPKPMLPDPEAEPVPDSEPAFELGAVRESAPEPEPEPAPGGRSQPAGPILQGRWACRYAGAMLLHPFSAHVGAGDILGGAAGAGARPGDAALLWAVSSCFALGAGSVEQFKHLAGREAGALAGLAGLPELRSLRPALARIADAADPLALQAAFAQAMLSAWPVTSGVYYVDDHFVPYTGAKPVGKGWNNKRGRAEKGRADTHVTAHDGRAVCFVTGEPSGLSATLPLALAELKRAAPDGAKILLGFDRGGAYPQVFRHCREQGVHWVTYRRAPLAVPATLPVITTITAGGTARQIAWAEETVTLTGYGQARQITLFEAGQVALQILTSCFDTCPAEILTWLKSRWREENFLKYASANYGIDAICDYLAESRVNDKLIDNPARKTAKATVRDAQRELATARQDYATMLADPAIPAAAKNTRLIPAAHKTITQAQKALAKAEAARDALPAKLPANQADPTAQVAVLRAGRRGLQMILRILAHNAEHWLATHLGAYLRDDDEYRATTRETIIRGLAGAITYTPTAITVELETPQPPRVARALALLLEEINADPPNTPGDTRPITYRLVPRAPALNN